MQLGLPNFGDLSAPSFNPLIYPRRILIEVLESLFSQSTLVIYPGSVANPFQYIAEDDEVDRRSKIVIADGFSQELRRTDPRPTVVINRGTLQFSNMAIDSKRQYFAHSVVNTDEPTIATDSRVGAKFSDIMSMPIMINCYARQHAEVEQLSWIVAGAIRFFRQEIKDGAQLHKIDSPTIGPVTPFRGDAKIDMFLVPITLMIYQTLVWNTKTSATLSEISAVDFSNLSGSKYPARWNGISTGAIPTEIEDDALLVSRWLSPG